GKGRHQCRHGLGYLFLRQVELAGHRLHGRSVLSAQHHIKKWQHRRPSPCSQSNSTHYSWKRPSANRFFPDVVPPCAQCFGKDLHADGRNRSWSVLIFVEHVLHLTVPPAVVERKQVVGERRLLGEHLFQ